MTTRIYVDQGVVATRYLDKYPYPNDITQLPALIPGIILQADFDINDPASLTRNRVGAAMTAVGSPTLGDYGVTVSESNHLNTNIDISAYNASNLTEISISVHPGAVRAILGRNQINAPGRSRGIQTGAATWRSVWLNSAGAAQAVSLTPASPAPDGEMVVSQFIRDNGSGAMVTKIDLPRTLQSNTVTATATPYSMPSSNALIGASADAATTGTVFVRAALLISREITPAELAMIYLYYKNHYQLKGKNI